MNNIKKTIWNQRIPSFMGIFVLVVSLISLTWLSRNVLLFGTRASLSATPNSVQISNITDTSFTVSYLTDERVTGTISYGKTENLGETAYDDRDKGTQSSLSYRVHHITIAELLPNTTYYFSIISNNETFTNNGKPYTVTTGPKIQTTDNVSPALRGTVAFPDGSVPTEALAFFSTPNLQLISVLVNPDGSYALPGIPIRSKDLKEYLTLTNTTEYTILLATATTQSTVSLIPSEGTTIPPVTFEQNYEFNATAPTEASESASASISATIPAFPTVEIEKTNEPQILTPKEEEAFDDAQPLFQGTASPNAEVLITINSEQIITKTVTADDSGKWEYRPETPLDPGEHTITIDTTMEGLKKTLTQSFTVYAEGSKFTEPSVSPTKPTLSPTKTPTPTKKVTATPTQKVTPTKVILPSVVISPTALVSATNTPMPSQASTSATIEPSIAPSGSSSLLLTIGGTIAMIGVGALLFFFAML